MSSEWLAEDLRDELAESVESCTNPAIDREYLASLIEKQHGPYGAVLGERALYSLLVMMKAITHADQQVHATRAAILELEHVTA